MGRISPSGIDWHTDTPCTPSTRAKSSGQNSPKSQVRLANTHRTPPRPAQLPQRQPPEKHHRAEAHQGDPHKGTPRKQNKTQALPEEARRRTFVTPPPGNDVFKKSTMQSAAAVRSENLRFSPGARRRGQNSHIDAFKKGTTSVDIAAAARDKRHGRGFSLGKTSPPPTHGKGCREDDNRTAATTSSSLGNTLSP